MNLHPLRNKPTRRADFFPPIIFLLILGSLFISHRKERFSYLAPKTQGQFEAVLTKFKQTLFSNYYAISAKMGNTYDTEILKNSEIGFYQPHSTKRGNLSNLANDFFPSVGLRLLSVSSPLPEASGKKFSHEFIWKHFLPENTGLRSSFISFLLGQEKGLVIGHLDGIDQLNSGIWKSLFEEPDFFTCGIHTKFFSGQENLCIGTLGKGILLFQNANYRFVTKSGNGVPFNHIRSICANSSGPLWIGTDEGLIKWKEGNYKKFGRAEGLLELQVISLGAYEDSVAVGTTGGLTILEPRRVQTFSAFENNFPMGEVRSVSFFDKRWWVCTSSGLGALSEKGMRVNPIPDLIGMHPKLVTTIGEFLAIGTVHGLYVWNGTKGSWILRYPGEPITSLAVFENKLAVGTWGNGIWVMENALQQFEKNHITFSKVFK